MHLIYEFWKDRGGATAIEYALIAAGVSIVILVAVTRIGSNIQQNFYIKISGGLN